MKMVKKGEKERRKRGEREEKERRKRGEIDR